MRDQHRRLRDDPTIFTQQQIDAMVAKVIADSSAAQAAASLPADSGQPSESAIQALRYIATKDEWPIAEAIERFGLPVLRALDMRRCIEVWYTSAAAGRKNYSPTHSGGARFAEPGRDEWAALAAGRYNASHCVTVAIAPIGKAVLAEMDLAGQLGSKPNSPHFASGELGSIPPFQNDSGSWITQKRAAAIAGITTQTLGKYRRDGQVSADRMSGIDRFGRIWRRQGTKASHPWYLKSSIDQAAGKS